MCGIVGYVGPREALPVILSGLGKLEYRGYDSAGIAVVRSGGGSSGAKGELFVARALGKLSALQSALQNRDDYHFKVTSTEGKFSGSAALIQAGIGHTRWATHGRPSEINAHPHTAGRVSLIHNGIVENYLELRHALEKEGSQFQSETDTEIAAHLLNRYLVIEKLSPFEALKATCRDIRGSYAFVAIDAEHPDRLLVAKNATPIIIGLGEGEVLLASDIPAILESTRKIMVLEDGDIAEIQIGKIRIENDGVEVSRPVETVTWDPVTAQKGGFKHFMLKEVHEQPRVLTDTLRGRLHLEPPSAVLPDLGISPEQISKIDRVVLLGCGTAWHACLVAKFYIEQIARIPCEVDYSSEFRYRSPILNDRTLVIAISQSGETADTLAAIDLVLRDKSVAGGVSTLAICNVLGSSLVRRSKGVLFTYAGPEISVASTKAFTTQLVSALLLAMHIGQMRKQITATQCEDLVAALQKLPGAMGEALGCEDKVEGVAKEFHSARDFLYLGRGTCYPIALEGALKLKEISYIHAEGYPAGEMKHGPIALIDEQMPVVVVLQRSRKLIEKAISNLKEVEARGGRIIVVTDALGAGSQTSLAQLGLEQYRDSVIEVPFLHEYLSPILLNIPLQLLAYHVAVLNGTDVDLPRNLAKSVTVE